MSEKKRKNMIQEINSFIDAEIRPRLQMDGGDIEFVDFENGIVKVRLQGACVGCPSSALTLYHGVEKSLKQKFPDDIKGLEQVDSSSES
jgi:Fe-S cluster biogenesis protein NfuA